MQRGKTMNTMGTREMEIKYNLKEEDYINFNLHHIQNSPSQRRIFNILRFVVPFLGGFIMYYIGTRQFKQPGIYWVVIAVLFIVLWTIFYPRRHEKSIKRQVRKMLSEGDNTSLFVEKTLLLEEDSIEILAGPTSERILRNNVKDIKVYNDIVVIYLSSINAHIIPTRYLADETKQFLIDYFSI